MTFRTAHWEITAAHRPALSRRLTAAAAVLGLLLALHTSTTSATPAEPTGHGPALTEVAAAPGSETALSGYAIQSTAKVSESAAEVSSPGCPTAGWYPAGPRSTALAALLAHGTHADPFYSTNLKKIPAADFGVLCWYRSDFTVTPTTAYADLKGLSSMAKTTVSATASTTAAGDGASTTTVTVRNAATAGPRLCSRMSI
ncbi:hypothetical protein FBY35_4428 [Streptomyces sp. SLBN-118]|uniref:hypothetical protein n=1 Tax=Streptomyces sp. SLBN-118 TaxID=2768454 RepID=UPI00116A0759|nr:hypothetical protein FBY35_4428 [Streptomyces sp. SLBN-118]